MAEFCTTRGTASHLEQIIEDAERQLTLISPYLQIPDGLFFRMKAADARGVATKLVFRTDQLKPAERDKLTQLKRLSLFSLNNLHAKCYANERSVLISSMNLYAHSEQNNWEMGVLLTDADGDVVRKARAEIETIVREATEVPLRGLRALLTNAFSAPAATTSARPASRPTPNRSVQTRRGHCIRCSNHIGYAPQSPLCDTCYRTWAAWGNEDYPETTCHRCAKPADVTKARPLCYSCFREAPFTPARSAFS